MTMKLLKYKQICIIILLILVSSVHLCLGGDMKKKNIYEELVRLEQEKDWMMLYNLNRLLIIRFLGPKENKEMDIINLLSIADQWPRKNLQDDYAFSPDGSSIAFVICDDGGPENNYSHTRALYTLSIKDSQITNIIPYKKFTFIGYVCYAPDGRRIYFIGEMKNSERSLCSIDLQTKEITELVKDVTFVTTQACSPDGKEIVYTTHNDTTNIYYIAIYNFETKTSRKIAEGMHPAWSPEGEKIVFVGKFPESNFYTIHPDGTGKELLISNTLLDKFKISGIFGESVGSIDVVFGGMLWSPDGKYLYYTRAAVLHILDTAEHHVSFVMDVKTKKSIRLPKPCGRIKSWIGRK